MSTKDVDQVLRTVWRVYGSIIAASIAMMIQDGIVRDEGEAVMIASRIAEIR